MRKLLNTIQMGTIILLAAGAPVVAVLDEKFWFEKRVVLAGAAVILLALWASRTWRIGRIGPIGPMNQSLGWLLSGTALLVAAVLPPGRVANLATPDLWAGLGAVMVAAGIGRIGPIGPIRWGFVAAVVGVVVAAVVAAAGIGRIGPIGPIRAGVETTAEILQRSPISGEFREFRVARLGILQVASGLGILGILGVLALTYQLGLKSAKTIIKSGSIWEKLLNILVLVLLAAFLLLPHPALTLWPLAITAALAGGISQIGPISSIGPIRRAVWAGLVGLLIVAALGSSYGLGRVVWGEMKFREALAAANRNEGIATYYALLESIKRNPYEVRYHLLASQIDIALANSIASVGVERAQPDETGSARTAPTESTPSAGLTAQDQNNILILIQQAVVEGKQAIKLDPENSLLWQNLASIYRSLTGVAGGAEDWALKSYQRAVELNPKDPNPHLFIGEIHFLAGNFQGAAEAFEEAVRIGPNFARAHYDLAVAYNALNESDKAIEELRETLALLPADSPDRGQVEKDLAFLVGGVGVERAQPEEAGSARTAPTIETQEPAPSEELKEATSSAEVEAPPPPVGPEATESAETKEPKGLEE